MARKPTTAEIAADEEVATGMGEMSLVHDWDDEEMMAVMAIAEGLLRSRHNPGAVAGTAATLWEGAKRLYPLIVERHSDSPVPHFDAMVELAEIFQSRGYPLDWNILEVHETLVDFQSQPGKPLVQQATLKRRRVNWPKCFRREDTL